MKLHSDTLTEADIYAAREETVEAGLMAAHVHFDKMDPKGSRTRDHGFEIHLASDVKYPGDGRRRPNGGNYGAAYGYAATYDEWGHFIARVFEKDPNAVFGPYKGEQGFREMTRFKY